MSIITRIKQEIWIATREYKFFWFISSFITASFILLFSLVRLLVPMAKDNIWAWLAFPGEKIFFALAHFQVGYFLYPLLISLCLILASKYQSWRISLLRNAKLSLQATINLLIFLGTNVFICFLITTIFLAVEVRDELIELIYLYFKITLLEVFALGVFYCFFLFLDYYNKR